MLSVKRIFKLFVPLLFRCFDLFPFKMYYTFRSWGLWPNFRFICRFRLNAQTRCKSVIETKRHFVGNCEMRIDLMFWYRCSPKLRILHLYTVDLGCNKEQPWSDCGNRFAISKLCYKYAKMTKILLQSPWIIAHLLHCSNLNSSVLIWVNYYNQTVSSTLKMSSLLNCIRSFSLPYI